MKKILVTGANGQLGSELSVLSTKYSNYEWFLQIEHKLLWII